MYAFISLQAYLTVRASKMTLAEAIAQHLVYREPRSDVLVCRVDGLAILCLIPF